MLRVFPDEESLAREAAGIFVGQCEEALGRAGRFSVVLSGGRTPMRTYELLGAASYSHRVDWSRVYIFWGDERCVTATDPRSNYRAAEQALLSRVPIPLPQIHPILGALDPPASASAYEAVLRRHFGGSPPLFDLVFLGLGRDGHTASLFPGNPSLHEEKRWVVPVQNQGESFARITMTAHLLNQSRMALFLVTGEEKAEILREALADKPSRDLPARHIHPIGGSLVWLVGPAAIRSTSMSTGRGAGLKK